LPSRFVRFGSSWHLFFSLYFPPKGGPCFTVAASAAFCNGPFLTLATQVRVVLLSPHRRALARSSNCSPAISALSRWIPARLVPFLICSRSSRDGGGGRCLCLRHASLCSRSRASSRALSLGVLMRRSRLPECLLCGLPARLGMSL
jgi:hypothetical protein